MSRPIPGLSEHQEKLVASYRKRSPYVAPELRDDVVDQLIEDLIGSERRRLGSRLAEILGRDLTDAKRRDQLLSLAHRCAKGEP